MALEKPLHAACDEAGAGQHPESAGAVESGAPPQVSGEPTYALVVLGGGVAAVAAARQAVGRGARAALVLPEAFDPTAPEAAEGEFGRRLLAMGARLGELPGEAPPKDERLDIYRASARFLDRHTLEVGGKRLRFRRAIIATGAQPASPDIPRAVESGSLGVADLGRLAGPPARVAVIGTGPTACVWAQSFSRLGSRVHLVVTAAALLPGEEPEVAALLGARLQAEGVCVRLQSAPLKVERTGNLRAVVIQTTAGMEKLLVDEVLICTEPVPRIEGLGLEAAGVAFDAQGILVDERMRTSCRGIFGAGRVCRGPFGRLSPAAESGRLAADNAVGWYARRLNPLALACRVPTDPEVVRVGLSRAEASTLGMHVQTLRAGIPARASAAAVLPGPGGLEQQPALVQHPQGLVILHLDVRSRCVVGVTAVAEGAGELLASVRAALGTRRRLDGLLDLCAAPGSRLEVVVRLAEKWVPSQRRGRLSRLRTYLRFVARRLVGLR